VSSHFGFPLSTTHVATGSILGSGVGKKGASVRWPLARRMFVAWLVTVPAAALVGAAGFGVEQVAGPYAAFVLLLAVAVVLVVHARRKPVNHKNVNDAWEAGGGAESAIAESLLDHDPKLLVVRRKRKKRKKRGKDKKDKKAKKDKKDKKHAKHAKHAKKSD
jgi:PiT family inorganic phosphate transporter